MTHHTPVTHHPAATPQTTPQTRTRRAAIATGAAVTATAALAACGSTDQPANSPAPGGSAPAASPGQQLALLSEVPVGQAKAVTTPDGQDAIVVRTGEATVAAFSAICTHQGCKVKPEGAELNCPCHGSRFDTMTGQVKKGPAKEPLPAIAVKVDGDKVVTG